MALDASLAAFEFRNMGRVNAILSGQLRLFLRAAPDFFYICIGKPTVPMVKPIVMPFTDSSISIVVGYGADLKMFWVNALWVIARVSEYLSFWNWSDKLFVNPTMGADSNLPRPANQGNNSVSVAVSVSRPEPARRSFLDASFKGYWRKHTVVFLESFSVVFLRIAEFAKVAAKSGLATQQAFSLTLFHGRPSGNGPTMTLP